MAERGLCTVMTARRIAEEWVHLGLGATALPQEPFDGMDWYARYEQRNVADDTEGRLVSGYTFSKDWDAWEMHPEGAEVVICTGGALILLQEVDGEVVETSLSPGEYAINPPGIWHTANVPEKAEAIFITAGKGTQHRPR